jgi:hypothetical protein
MALETQYIVSRNSEDNYPVVYRVILVDGVEVNRGEADFTEVKAAYPAVIEEYFNAVALWAHELADYLDAQTEFTANNFVTMRNASRLFYDFMQKFDYIAIADSPELPHLQEPPVVEETPVEETPVEETPVTE